MILKAIDLLRELGWGVVSLIYNFIDTIYDVILKIDELDIIGTMSGNNMFKNFHSSIVVIALTVFALFVTWQFVKKIIEPDEGASFSQILYESFKCGILVLLSTFLFIQITTFSIQLSGFVGNFIQNQENTSLGTSLLTNYIQFSNGYKNSETFENDNYENMLKDGSYGADQHYNDKYVKKDHWIRSDERDYKYDINWIMACLCGGFFLYALVFASIMLAKRQLEFLFLFLISPIVFATSVCNKQRRNALVEQLVSLTVQATAVMLIIGITSLLAGRINATHFFDNTFQNMITKSVLYMGSAIFLLNGSQTINRFIGSNVSANSGREQLMSLMGFGRMAKAGGLMTAGVGLMGAGAVTKGVNAGVKKTGIARKFGDVSNHLLSTIGSGIAGFANNIAYSKLPDGSKIYNSSGIINKGIQNIGYSIKEHGLNMSYNANKRNANYEGLGINKKISSGTSIAMKEGLKVALNQVPAIKRVNWNPYLYKKQQNITENFSKNRKEL